MLNSHVGHDTVMGNHNILTNAAALGGHVQMGNGVTLSAYCSIHQFCMVGDYAFIAHASQCTMDILPFLMVDGGAKPRAASLNIRGLQRNGFSKAEIATIRQAFKILFLRGSRLEVAIQEIQALVSECPKLQAWLDMIAQSKRGILR